MTIYLDNAATSYPKPESVYRAVDVAAREFGGNPGRGGHRMAVAAARLVFEARETVAGFFGIADSSRLVFTASATMAINQALFGLLQPGDRVVTSTAEHNAVTRPLRVLQERGVTVVKVAADARGYVAAEAVRRACAEPTALVVLSHCSNVTGTVQPVAELGPWCRSRGIPFLVDAAQSAGLFPIDVEGLGIDFLAAPGHKGLLGPAGTGLLYVREGFDLRPLMVGGTGTTSHSDASPPEMPERLECGTLNTPGLAGLKAGVEFLLQEGLTNLRQRETALLAQLLGGLGQIPGVQLYGPPDAAEHGSAVSFNIDGHDPAEVGYHLDHDYDILTRVGLHCAPDLHRSIGTLPRGTVRVSPGPFSTAGEIELLLTAVRSLARNRRD